MAVWLPYPGLLIKRDVVRWTEPVWHPSPCKRKSYPAHGMRRVTAEVLAPLSGKRFLISVIDENILVNRTGQALQPYPRGEPISKNRRTIVRGQPERLMWHHETARARAMGQHLASRCAVALKPSKPPARSAASGAQRRKR